MGAIGINFNRYLGAEVAAEFTETELTSDQFGKIAEYSLWSTQALLRLRYPVLDDRLSPYLLLGGGIGFGELNDRVLPIIRELPVAGGRTTSMVASAGLGFDYFIADNIAIGIEARQTFLFEPEITVNHVQRSLSLDLVSVTAGLRVFFP